MRICLTCSAYYADDSVPFCLIDGMPLMGVERGCEIWNDGARAIAEKTAASKKRTRRVKLQRIALGLLTLLLATVVVSKSVTVETVTPPKPTPTEESKTTATVTPTPTPSPTPTPTPSPTPTATPTASPTPTPTPTQTLTPVRVYTIAGHVTEGGKPRGGVSITLQGTKSLEMATDANGYYSFNNLPRGSYTVTPSRPKMTFKPASQPFGDLKQDSSADFSAQTEPDVYKISGHVTEENGKPVRDVDIMLAGTKINSAKTDSDGGYSFSNLPAGGNYSLTARKARTSFKPPNQRLNNLRQNGTADFSARVEQALYKITGRVTENGKGARDVRLTLSRTQNAAAITDANGYYSFTGLPPGDYKIEPTRPKTRFTHRYESRGIVDRDWSSVDFTAEFQADPEKPDVPSNSGVTAILTDCSEADRDRTARGLFNQHGAGWRQKFESERRDIIEFYARKDLHAEIISGQIEYAGASWASCLSVRIKASYVWQVRISSALTGTKTESHSSNRSFQCFRFGSWQCSN